MFKLQQFAIEQNKCAMKVCTDALIFGAMAPIQSGDSVLDIGAGTGILSLMAKQQGAAKVTAIELNRDAASQAQDNVSKSSWAKDIEVICCDICNYKTDEFFDLVIANPPFFEDHLKNPCEQRNTARHTDTLSYHALMTSADRLLNVAGTIYLLLPLHAKEKILESAAQLSLHLVKQIDYITMEGGKAKLAAFEFSRDCEHEFLHESITIYRGHQQYTQQSSAVLKHYLLRFAKD